MFRIKDLYCEECKGGGIDVDIDAANAQDALREAITQHNIWHAERLAFQVCRDIGSGYSILAGLAMGSYSRETYIADRVAEGLATNVEKLLNIVTNVRNGKAMDK